MYNNENPERIIPHGTVCCVKGCFSGNVRFKDLRSIIPFWYRVSNMMDRQLNKGSSKIAYAVRAGARSLTQEKQRSFTIPDPGDCKHQTCAVDCNHIIRHTVPFQVKHLARVEGGRSC